MARHSVEMEWWEQINCYRKEFSLVAVGKKVWKEKKERTFALVIFEAKFPYLIQSVLLESQVFFDQSNEEY